MKFTITRVYNFHFASPPAPGQKYELFVSWGKNLIIFKKILNIRGVKGEKGTFFIVEREKKGGGKHQLVG